MKRSRAERIRQRLHDLAAIITLAGLLATFPLGEPPTNSVPSPIIMTT